MGTPTQGEFLAPTCPVGTLSIHTGQAEDSPGPPPPPEAGNLHLRFPLRLIQDEAVGR